MEIFKIILIIGLYQTVVLGALVLIKKQKCFSDWFLALLFVVFALSIFLGYMEIYNRENNYPLPVFIGLSAPIIFLHGPVIWLYIKSITTQKFRFKAKYLLHVLPFIGVAVALSSSIYSMPASERIISDSTKAFKKDLVFPVVIAMIFIFTQGYFFWGLWLIKRYRSKISNYFSEFSAHDLAWLKNLLVSCIFFMAESVYYTLPIIFCRYFPIIICSR